jgi:peptide/nickel transport system substrate-binding protein
MARQSLAGLVLLATLLVTACAGGRAPAASPGAVGDSAVPSVGAPVSSSRTLSVALRVEPVDVLNAPEDRGVLHKALLTATLSYWDERGQAASLLADGLPKLNTDTWRINPNGSMETTFRLRPNLTWHDGTPLTAEDFVFTHRAEQARIDVGLNSTSAERRQIEEIIALDAQTLVIKWKQPYTEAAAPQLVPISRSIVGPVLTQGDMEAFSNLPYWKTDYVGAGPYRLERWELGSFIELAAFDGYALGKPKISRVRMTWNNDPNVNVTRLLSGDADMAADGSLRFEQASTLRAQWSNSGQVLLSPTSLRYIQFQARPEYVSPKSLLDLRAKRAISHSLDRLGLAEAMVADTSMAANTYPPPTVPYYNELQRTVTRYAHDPRLAEQLLAELGYAKGADGIYANVAEGPLRFEVRGVSGGQEEQDTTIVSQALHDAGMDTTIRLLPSSTRAVDEMTKGTFPGLTLNNNTVGRRDFGLDKFITARIGGPWDNWAGGNRMGYSNPEFDRLFDTWSTSLDPSERTARLLEMMKILSDDLPALPLYYNFQILAHSSALKGPQRISPETSVHWNAHLWTLVQ